MVNAVRPSSSGLSSLAPNYQQANEPDIYSLSVITVDKKVAIRHGTGSFGSPGQWVIWVIFHVRVTGSSFWPGVRPEFFRFSKKVQDKDIKMYIFVKIRPTVIEILTFNKKNLLSRSVQTPNSDKNWQTSCPLQTFVCNISQHLEFMSGCDVVGATSRETLYSSTVTIKQRLSNQPVSSSPLSPSIIPLLFHSRLTTHLSHKSFLTNTPFLPENWLHGFLAATGSTVHILFLLFSYFFSCLFPRERLNWLTVSFWAHVNIAGSSHSLIHRVCIFYF